MKQLHKIFLAGGTGYIGNHLVRELIRRSHTVRCLAREKSVHKLPEGCIAVSGNALDENSFCNKIFPSDTFIHLIGVSRPNPFKGEQFRKIDLVSLKHSVAASVKSGIKNFIYLSVAHPAPVMKEYINVRKECEKFIGSSGLNATILRPWYVLGPGHRWPYLLVPVYKLADKIPSIKAPAKRLGLVTLRQITDSLIDSVENPPSGIRIINAPEIGKKISGDLVNNDPW